MKNQQNKRNPANNIEVKGIKLKSALNLQQNLAVQADKNPILIVAGAGTGKTLTLTNRLLHLIAEGEEPSKICALTFTNKAAREMADRLVSSGWGLGASQLKNRTPDTSYPSTVSLGQSNRQLPFIGTLHSFGAKILRAECESLGRSYNFAIFDDGDSLRLARKIVKKGCEREKAELGPALISQRISEIKSGTAKISDLKKSNSSEDKLTLKIFGEYEKELQKNNAFDFDDLIQKVVHIFKKEPAILKKYQKKHLHILIDEYQDLNGKQHELIRILTKDLASRRGSLSAVGDDNQMIYSWRGSDINIFLDFEKDWPMSQTVLLEENYRSTACIIRAAQAVIQNNRYQKPKTLWTKNPEGSRIKLVEAGSDEEESEWIAEKIQELKIKNQNETTAVLYRTNAQSRAIEQSLIASNIPYRIFGGVKFYERREIKDAVAALRYFSNPKDELSLERLEKNLGKSRFYALKTAIGGVGREAEPSALLDTFIKAADYFTYLQRNFTDSSERRENVIGLLRFASEFNDLNIFLERIALLEAHDKPGTLKKSAAAGAVTLTTIHLAKGLEFDQVFIAGCSEGLMPHSKSLYNEKDLEEERRLMYVAMTRARKELCISFYDIPSRFISEIPNETYEFFNLTSGAREFTDDEERYIRLD